MSQKLLPGAQLGKSLESGPRASDRLPSLAKARRHSSNQRKQVRAWGENEAEAIDFPGATGPGSGVFSLESTASLIEVTANYRSTHTAKHNVVHPSLDPHLHAISWTDHGAAFCNALLIADRLSTDKLLQEQDTFPLLRLKG